MGLPYLKLFGGIIAAHFIAYASKSILMEQAYVLRMPTANDKMSVVVATACENVNFRREKYAGK